MDSRRAESLQSPLVTKAGESNAQWQRAAVPRDFSELQASRKVKAEGLGRLRCAADLLDAISADLLPEIEPQLGLVRRYQKNSCPASANAPEPETRVPKPIRNCLRSEGEQLFYVQERVAALTELFSSSIQVVELQRALRELVELTGVGLEQTIGASADELVSENLGHLRLIATYGIMALPEQVNLSMVVVDLHEALTSIYERELNLAVKQAVEQFENLCLKSAGRGQVDIRELLGELEVVQQEFALSDGGSVGERVDLWRQRQEILSELAETRPKLKELRQPEEQLASFFGLSVREAQQFPAEGLKLLHDLVQEIASEEGANNLRYLMAGALRTAPDQVIWPRFAQENARAVVEAASKYLTNVAVDIPAPLRSLPRGVEAGDLLGSLQRASAAPDLAAVDLNDQTLKATYLAQEELEERAGSYQKRALVRVAIDALIAQEHQKFSVAATERELAVEGVVLVELIDPTAPLSKKEIRKRAAGKGLLLGEDEIFSALERLKKINFLKGESKIQVAEAEGEVVRLLAERNPSVPQSQIDMVPPAFLQESIILPEGLLSTAELLRSTEGQLKELDKRIAQHSQINREVYRFLEEITPGNYRAVVAKSDLTKTALELLRKRCVDQDISDLWYDWRKICSQVENLVMAPITRDMNTDFVELSRKFTDQWSAHQPALRAKAIQFDLQKKFEKQGEVLERVTDNLARNDGPVFGWESVKDSKGKLTMRVNRKPSDTCKSYISFLKELAREESKSVR